MTKAELTQEFGQLAEAFLERVKVQAAEASKGASDPALKATIDAMNAKLDELETKMHRPAILGNIPSDRGSKAARTAEYQVFNKFLKARNGKAALKPEEQKLIEVGSLDSRPEEIKVLTETDDTGGGFLAPPEFVAEIIKGVILYSPVRSLAKIRTTAMRSVRVPKRTGTFAAQWTSEIGTRSETTGLTYGLEEVPVHELYALSDISNADLEDSAFDLNAELQMEFSEQFAKAEGAAFVNGTMVGQPEGFMTNAAVAADVTGNSATLSYNGFVAIAHNLKSFYASQAVWVMNRKTLGAVRQIVDGNSRPIWQPFGESGLSGPNPSTIMGMPYQELPDMPDVGASTYPVALADWKRAYMVLDRIAIEIQRDPFTQNVKGVTRYVARKRVGGQVVLAEAVRKLQCHT